MIKVMRFTNGMVCILTATEHFEDLGFTVKDSYTVKEGTVIGYLHTKSISAPMKACGDGIHHVYCGTTDRCFKIEDIELAQGEYFTIDLGGRCTTYRP